MSRESPSVQPIPTISTHQLGPAGPRPSEAVGGDFMTTQSHTVSPGDQFAFTNALTKAIRIRIVTACGAETIADLHPGARVQLTVGASPVNVYLLSADQD